jgi:biotin carboxylase
MPNKITIWFSHPFPNGYLYINQTREHWLHGQLTVIGSHPDDGAPALQACDIALPEPETEGFLDWALKVVTDHHVDVFIPRHHLPLIAENKHLFDELGCNIVLPSSNPQVLDQLEDKALAYELAQRLNIPVPIWRAFSKQNENPHKVMQETYREVRQQVSRVCVKPLLSAGGRGFMPVQEEAITVSAADFAAQWKPGVPLDTLIENADSLPDLMVMELLPGPEHSIDCLADNGKLISSVVRTKIGQTRTIIEDSALTAYCARLVEELELSGLFNVQFLEDAKGAPKLLEVNARISGGVDQCGVAGAHMVLAAIELALFGQCSRNPRAQLMTLTLVNGFVTSR